MADKTLRIPGYLTDGTTEVEVLLVDNGDGTYSVGTAGAGGGAVTIADGADVVLGALADAVVAAGAAGTVSAKLRRLTTDLNTLIGHSDGIEGLLTTIAALSKVEDAAAADGDTGVMALSVRRDTAASSAGAAGDYATLNTDNTGRLWVRVGIVDALTPGTAAANLGKAEDAAHASGDTGVFMLGVRNDGSATSFSGTNGDYTPIATDDQGNVQVVRKAVTPTQTSVAGSASSVSLLAANNARKGATVFNDSSALLYLKLGATASTTSYTTQVQPGGYYEVPFGYIGAIDGIWSSATGNARITELA